MISTQPIMNCSNPDCNQPINNIGDRLCKSCQTPLVYRYLWATGSMAAEITPGTKVADRYEVITEQIWLDTQPGLTPEFPSELPPTVIPYLKLYPEQLHIPQPYGFTSSSPEEVDDILLLENAPIDSTGNLYPIITEVWEEAKAVRQAYWLWQILQLWTPLSELGVAASLLSPNNLRVQGWCVKLLELHQTPETLTLQDLGHSWQSWVLVAKAEIAQGVGSIIHQMCRGTVDLETITHELNQLLLAAAAELPLMLTVAGVTDKGAVMKHNEDACHPSNSTVLVDNNLNPHLSIVCDGIGGHEGGEVASQLAVQSLKLQTRALLQNLAEQTEIFSPSLLQQQLAASLRVVNNMIWSRNDEQNRQGRERMATTLVMAIQLPQRIMTNSGWESENTHELYLANVGDSRAYWITTNYCQLLTIDDDMATRTVCLGQSLYRQAIQTSNANALTQALGTKEAEFLNFAIKRLILEEDGILLLCSDGLSDHHWVEQSWQDFAVPVLTGKLNLEDAAHNWVKLANAKNGQDNISVVLTLCRISQAHLVPVPPASIVVESTEEELAITAPQTETSELEVSTTETLTDSSQALLNLDLAEKPALPPTKERSRGRLVVMLGGFLVLLVGGTGLGLFAWWQLQPESFGKVCRQLPPQLEKFCPK
ncbi:protein phosphatase 2C domain-containing protein [Sphaerospermopsis aphanizomenoides BCCUSP55]|uniref:PP2C family protein-serine/threonine phosphatase n=1 Tax=Sphaerospermopsis aphanizomenoides TaxID=459663 RepID=UPI0019042D54|nr:protein phosphatase 2C domain-containing protein [Sphaerospermopsis aphanizomenoides]MBK1986077.1 protein phosphatase 2C domain-containing protein [Sphaerospermopsis aphanizomenoides BCCUSP55]